MNLKQTIQNFIEGIDWISPKEPAELLMKAYTYKAQLKNRIFEIELQNIDPTSRTALEKQQMQIAKENEEYRQLQTELELINAGIKALETYLKVYEINQKEDIR